MTTTTTTFAGWDADATAFLAELTADNTREFWMAHSARHAASVLPPLRALAAALEPEFGPLRIFRPYRDRRFRSDAPPYRTDAGGAFTTPGGTEYSVVLAATGLAVRVGRYALAGAALRRYRAALAGPSPGYGPVGAGERAVGDGAGGRSAGVGGGDAGWAAGPGTGGVPGPEAAAPARREAGDAGAALAAALAAAAAGGLVPGTLPALRGRPRGVAADHPHLEWLRLRALHVGVRWPAGPWLATAEPLERVRAAWRAAGPLATWLDAHVGPDGG